jgi:hypothetical protein
MLKCISYSSLGWMQGAAVKTNVSLIRLPPHNHWALFMSPKPIAACQIDAKK